MKNFISIFLIGLIIKSGFADVSHLHKQENNGYLPPHNRISSQHNIGQSNYQSVDNESRGYLAPYQQNSQHHQHEHQDHHDHHDHQDHHDHHDHHQQEERGYLPPTQSHNHQEQIHNNGHSHQHVDENRGYLPPTQIQTHNNEQQDDRGYLPPYQKQHEDHEHHHHNHGQNQGGIDPSLQVSYYDHHAVSLQHHEHSKDSYPKDEYEDNSNGYNYAPPKNSFDETSHQHHHGHENSNHINGPLSTGSVGVTSQKSIQQDHHHHHHHEETQKNEEHHHHDSSRDYLPPIQSSHTKEVEHVENTQTSILQTQENEESYQEDERGYLPPIGALELPQSSDTLHTIPPAKLGIPIVQKSTSKPDTDHINVPLPIPEVGYYFIPGVRSKLPFLSEIENEPLTNSDNAVAIESHHHEHEHEHQDHQHHHHHHHHEHQHPQDYSKPSSSIIRIIPSVQTAQEISSQGYLTPSQVVTQHQHFADIDFPLPDSNQLDIGQQNQNFPPLSQLQQQDQFVNQHFEQNQNQIQSQSNFKNFAKSVVHGLNNQQNQITTTLESSNNNGYLPPVDNYHQHHHNHNHHQEIYSHKQTQTAIHNQVTNLQTYMDNVNPNDRYGFFQFEPKHAIESNPPPENPPLMYSKPSAVEAYAPGMAYKTATNSFTQAGYLPPIGASKLEQSQLEFSPSIELELNDEDKKDLNLSIDNDNTVLPLAEILGVQGDEMNQIMRHLHGNVRTIQITNHHDHSVKNIKVRDSSNHAGERTIEILGQSHAAPMGDHKVLHVINKASNPQDGYQTIKIFNDSEEVPKPSAKYEYLPPSNTEQIQQTNLHKFRRSFKFL